MLEDIFIYFYYYYKYIFDYRLRKISNITKYV